MARPQPSDARQPFPKVWERTAGGVEYHCFKCGKWLMTANFRLQPGQWVQAICKWCGNKERRFTAED